MMRRHDMKNKFLKKIVALTLAGCFALGALSFAAFASEQEIMTESSETEVTSEQAAAELAVPSMAEAIR